MSKFNKSPLTLGLLVAGLLSAPALALADEPAAPAAPPAADAKKPPVPTLSDVLGASGVDFNGYVDVGYTNLQQSSGTFITGTNVRTFDFEPNSFNIHQVAFTLDKLPKDGFGALANVIIGRDADVIASNGTGTAKEIDFTQAYLNYASGPFTWQFGKFVTLSGAEVIDSRADYAYSRSILFGYAIPFTHTGVRMTYAAKDNLSLIAGVNNGWDQVQDLNKQKTVELGLSWAPVKTFTIASSFYAGTEPIFPRLAAGATPAINQSVFTDDGKRQLWDVVLTWNASDKATVILNYDHAKQDASHSTPFDANALGVGTKSEAVWSGWAAYLNYAFNDLWHTTIRYERFNDQDGYRTGGAILYPTLGFNSVLWKEYTLMLGRNVGPSTEIRAELRHDTADQTIFGTNQATGPIGGFTSFGLEGIYKF